MTVVWRVENYKGQGPYVDFCIWDNRNDEWAHGKTHNSIWIRGHRYPAHPNPGQEGLNRSDVHLCGFESLDQLLSWFTWKEIRKMKRHGFRVVRRQASEVVRGKKQLIFIPKEETRGEA